MRFGVILFGVVLAGTVRLLFAGDAIPDSIKLERERLQGIWMMVSHETGAATMTGAVVQSVKVAFVGDQYLQTTPSGPLVGAYYLNLSQSPRTIDFRPSDGTDKGQTVAGIYELEGDTLRLVYSRAGQARPTELFGRPSDTHTITVYKRIKR